MSLVTRIMSLFRILCISLTVTMGIVGITASLPIQAQANSCRAELERTKKISVLDVINFGNFIPVIPESCGKGNNGQPRPLTLDLVPYAAVRAYGALSSLGFYLFLFMLTFNGVRWTFEGLSSRRGDAKRSLLNNCVGLVVLLIGSQIVLTVLNLLTLNPDAIIKNY